MSQHAVRIARDHRLAPERVDAPIMAVAFIKLHNRLVVDRLREESRRGVRGPWRVPSRCSSMSSRRCRGRPGPSGPLALYPCSIVEVGR
jgi:hypothetical protein